MRPSPVCAQRDSPRSSSNSFAQAVTVPPRPSPALLHLEITLLFQRSASPRGDTRWCPSGAAKVDWSPLVLVPAGAMILPLELHEFVNRPDCFLILGRYANLSASGDRKSTRLNSSHVKISYAVFCLKKK